MENLKETDNGFKYESEDKLIEIIYSGCAINPDIRVLDKKRGETWELTFSVIPYKGTYGKFFLKVIEKVNGIEIFTLPYTGSYKDDHANIIKKILTYP